MRKFIASLLALAFLFCQPVFALVDNPQARFLTYVQQTYGINLQECSITDQTDANLASEITFPDNTPQNTQNSIIADAQTNYAVWGGWVPLPLPDYVNFRHDCLTDTTISNQPISLLCSIMLADSSLSFNDRKTLAVKCKAAMIATYGATPGANGYNAMNTYAINRKLPIQ